MPSTGRSAGGPSVRALSAWVLCALALHALLLIGTASPLALHGSASSSASTQPLRPSLPSAASSSASSTASSALAKPTVRMRLLPLAPPPSATPALHASTAWPTPAPPAAPTEQAAPSPHSEPAPLPQAAASLPAASTPLSEPTAVSEAAPEAPPPMPQTTAPSATTDNAAAPTPATDAATAWPVLSLGALPSSRVLHYQLTGMHKGLTYHASGELRWQHNDTDYALTLSIRTFLLGSRQWRSVGQIDANGLAPRRFSDHWRQERATHFDRAQQRVVFSSNSTPVPLQAGAQDQISLYVQLAAAMAGEPTRFAPGAQLQVQTATVRDAVVWSLVMQDHAPLELQGRSVPSSHWVYLPRARYDARIEFWVTAEQAWLPVRLRITQANDSYIDLLWRETQPLPALPAGVHSAERDKGV